MFRSLPRRLALAGLLLLPGVARPDAHAPVAIPEPLPLAWCLERARKANPDLERAAAAAEAAAQRIEPAGAFDDPRIAYEASNVPTGSFDFRSTPLSGHQFGLRQKLPFPGLLSSRERAASLAAGATDLDLDDRRIAIDAAVETAWAELGFAQRALRITRRNIALLRQLAATAESRYRVGNGLQQDVLRAQVELTALLQEDLRREASVARAEALLAALLDLPTHASMPPTQSLGLETERPELGALIAALEAHNPRLRASGARVEAARARVRVSELEGLPDVDLGIGYRLRASVAGDPVDGDDFLSAGLTLRLPINRKRWSAHVAEQKALLRHAEANRRAEHARLVADLRLAHAELTRASGEERLLETGLVPQAAQSLESSRSAYEVGRIEFLGVLDSQVRSLGAELRLARARADKRIAYAALEAAVGEKLR